MNPTRFKDYSRERHQLRSTVFRPLPSSLIEKMTPGQLLHHYLLASYAYYQLNESVWEDYAFDRICKRLLDCFDQFEHPHKHLTSVERLREGSGYHLREEDYPSIVRDGMCNFFEAINTDQFVVDFNRQLNAKINNN